MAVPPNASNSRPHDPSNERAFRKKVVISKSPFSTVRGSLPASPSDVTTRQGPVCAAPLFRLLMLYCWVYDESRAINMQIAPAVQSYLARHGSIG